MSDLKLGGLAFDRGIEQVIHARQDEIAALPERGESAPPEIGSRPRLDALLSRPNLDDALEEAIRPRPENRDLLAPGRFRQALDGALTQVRDFAARTQAESGADATGASAQRLRTLNRAARLLGDECGLRDLLQMYRSVLYQG